VPTGSDAWCCTDLMAEHRRSGSAVGAVRGPLTGSCHYWRGECHACIARYISPESAVGLVQLDRSTLVRRSRLTEIPAIGLIGQRDRSPGGTLCGLSRPRTTGLTRTPPSGIYVAEPTTCRVEPVKKKSVLPHRRVAVPHVGENPPVWRPERRCAAWRARRQGGEVPVQATNGVHGRIAQQIAPGQRHL